MGIKSFKEEVFQGLSLKAKQLSSKFFYDEQGSRIFQEIMQMDEYYLPKSETEILKDQSGAIISQIPFTELDVVELGAGDGTKTLLFLESAIQKGLKLTYIPLDISEDILNVNEENIKKILPELPVIPLPGDYFGTIKKLENRHLPRLIMFMGSNIGNFKGDHAIEFIQFVNGFLKPGDFFLMGVDLKKNPHTILKAYNDVAGITKRFNLNLLERINKELGGDFDLGGFDHYATYDPIDGAAESYLVSLKEQRVKIEEREFCFEKDEVIHMEISQKYSLEELDSLAAKTGFTWDKHFTDRKRYFSLSLFRK